MILVALGVLTWLLVGASLTWLMSRHGHDRVPWLLLGLMGAPLAVILALAELGWPTSACPRVLRPGQVQQGSLDVLVNLEPSPRSVEAAAKAPGSPTPAAAHAGPHPGAAKGSRAARRAAECRRATPRRRHARSTRRSTGSALRTSGPSPLAIRRQRQLLAGGHHGPARAGSRPARKRAGSRRSGGHRQSPEDGFDTRIAASPYPSSRGETGSDGAKTEGGGSSEPCARRTARGCWWKARGAKACD